MGLVGAVVGALVAAVPLLLTRGGGGGGLGASKDSISAPEALGAYRPMLKNSKVNGDTVKRLTDTESVSGKNLSAAYGGAGAVFRQYADDSIQNSFTLEAVRAESPKPFYPYVNPAQIGLAEAEQDVEAFGQVNCLIHYLPVQQGQTVEPDQVQALICERTSSHLTVRLRFNFGDAWHKPADAAALTDQAWSQLS
ncbi:MAG: hypothetical protein HOV87_08210 [Catenulispora sp.]|nr:hypothetical protein [Catenulispora sp.]